MGNYCSSGQKKGEKDDISQKSDDSPTYQLSNKRKNSKNKCTLKGAPLVDPEPTSDISNFNVQNIANNNGNIQIKENEPSFTVPTIDIGSPPATEKPAGPIEYHHLPSNLISFLGNPTNLRRIENDRTIVLYVLSAGDENSVEKALLNNLFDDLKQYCQCRGFELQLCDLHEVSEQFVDPQRWKTEPANGRGGYHLLAEYLSAITNVSNKAYVIPILFLGKSLGSTLVPLSIESQHFNNSLNSMENNSSGRQLLERWYQKDAKADPPCFRFNIHNDLSTFDEMEQLYKTLIEVFPVELRDFYLKTQLEQAINEIVLKNQNLARKCIWVHTGSLPTKSSEEMSGEASTVYEMNRRLTRLQSELKNQLSEKNITRIPPTVNMTNEQLTTLLKGLVASNIEVVINDHASECQIPYCSFGANRHLLEEIEIVKQHSSLLKQNSVNPEIMHTVKKYVSSTTNEPLIIFGPNGCGKSVLAANVEHNIHDWLPNCCFILRYARLTQISSNISSLFGSIVEQLHYFVRAEPYNGSHKLEDYCATFKECMQECKSPTVILIDALNELSGLDDFTWLPTTTNEHIKIIITITSNSQNIDEIDKCESNSVLWNLKNRLSKENFVHIDQFSNDKWNEILTNNCELQSHLLDNWMQCADKTPIQAKLFKWFAWLGKSDINSTTLSATTNEFFELLERTYGDDIIKDIFSLLIASRHGLTITTLIKLLKQSNHLPNTYRTIEQFWAQFSLILSHGPILLQNNAIRLMDAHFAVAASKRYANEIANAHRLLHAFYQLESDEFSDDKGDHHCFNQEKFNELPYHAFILDKASFPQSTYLTNLRWIQHKLNATKYVQTILNDIYLIDESTRNQHEHIQVLKTFIETHLQAINYDVSQFQPLLKHCLKDSNQSNGVFTKWLDDCNNIVITYLDIMDCPANIDNCEPYGFDLITNLGGYFVAAMSTKREEICVWNIPRSERVRCLRKIPQPTAICPIDKYGAAVLCKREINVIDLNNGALKLTLKGVMNQKMPYFAYCNDAQHLVCLSRNRMYVNLMNLESGDCITTFKAGEDRFLNSLLVSGDGRILVCGDETQKPFPLLVWHLYQRKLLYDLRIPHHDFITSLSAITHEGSYVCVVTKELNEPAPNFIVVYDLQSGTLFKKWKPPCNTVSLSISQTNACVIAGLEDARIFIWDLITGNCKYVLTGHTAAVTLLKLDPTGTILLSADKEGRDRSVRLWELATGKSIAVHTSSKKISTCEILPNGEYVVLALENEPNLVILELKNSIAALPSEYATNKDDVYGESENNGKIFQL